MKVQLSIKDDKELRNMIKDMIRGQVKSVTREDIKKYLIESIMSEKQIEDLFMKAIEKIIKKELGIDDSWRTNKIGEYSKKIIEKEISKFFQKKTM